MAKKNTIFKLTVITVILLLFLAPIIILYKLSGSEKKSYIQDTYYEYKEAAYGEPIRVTRADIEYYVTTDGVISSSEYITIDIKDIESDNILVQPGNEIYKDKEITTGQKIIKAPCNGIVESVDTGNRIRVLSFDKLQLVTNIPIDKLNYIKESKSLSFNENEKLTVREISNIAQDNKVKVVFDIDSKSYMYGEELPDIKIYTDKVYSEVLVVNKNCVYKKGNSYYVRVLDENGYYINEQEVKVSLETEEYMAISGVEEGTICDSGYKAFIRQEDGNGG
ncbi:MAG TPA: hypothetical protein DCX93_02950 [Butyrivibrio sp.]|jgi:hypothetical protein|uniref:hypothetical protein n=1 Tax=Eshraghiella crossota TaxID=45851 RepID=UPI000E85215D|nr:hypothetical protein [Butyrivibrio sp.]HAX07007.1 hypothetical protein [Butyrivibrio sp.]